MRATILLLFTALCLCVYGQNETGDSLNISNKSVIDYKPLNTTASESLQQSSLNTGYDVQVKMSHEGKDSLMKRLNIHIPPYYVGPGDQIRKIPTTHIVENNYNYQALYGLSDRAWLGTTSERRIYPGMGGVSNISATLSYQLSDQWIISGSPYISKYSINNNHFNDAGIGGQVKFIAHDRIRLNAFGTYSANSKKNGIGSNYSGMFPQSSYGGTVEFKMTEKFGIETGMMRQLDPVSGRWKNIPIINPVFYVK